MKRYIRIILIVIINFSSSSVLYSNNIKFVNGSFIDLLKQAKEENKLIFIDCYTSWCHACKVMEQSVFTNDSVANFYNKNFICSAFNMQIDEGVKLKEQFDINYYPSFLFIDKEGHIVHRGGSFLNASDFIDLGKNALDSSKNYFHLKSKYDSGNRNSEFLYTYALAREKAKVFNMNTFEYDTVAVEYFNSQSSKELLNKKNWITMQILVKSIYDPMFDFLIHNKTKYMQLYGSATVDSIIYYIAFQSFISAPAKVEWNSDTALFYKAKEILKTCTDTSILNAMPFYEDLFKGANHYKGSMNENR